MDISQTNFNSSISDAKVNILRQNTEYLLVGRKDGFAPMEAKVEDKDVLLLTQSNQKILPTDQLKINEEIVEIKFVDNAPDLVCKKEFSPDVYFTALDFTVLGSLVMSAFIAPPLGVAWGVAIGAGAGLIKGALEYEDCKKYSE